ncbi:MAG: TolC family protein, partial [Deltaproteobacteria bacterium]|nr:TolC family protein [Deltaproteobacteria bacterium]
MRPLLHAALLAALAPALPCAAQPAPAHPALTLEEALSTARQVQPALLEAWANADGARARASQAHAPLLPQVNLSGSYSRTTANFVARPGTVPRSFAQGAPTFDTFNFFNAGVTGTQLLWDFGQARNRSTAAAAQAESADANARTAILDAEGRVRAAFFQAQAARALVRVGHDTLANQERHLSQVQAFVEVGTRPEIDLAQVKTDRANAQLQLIQAENGYDTARAQLLQAMGQERGLDFDVDGAPLAELPGEDGATGALLDEALAARPEFAALERERAALEATLASVRGTYWPQLSATVGATEGGADLTALAWNVNGGVNLIWPLYQGGLSSAQVAEAEANLRAHAARVATRRQQVRLEVEQAR